VRAELPWLDDVVRAKKPARLPTVSTTMIYTHALNKGGRGVISPLDC